MSELKYLDKRGTFTLDNPDLTSYMYFPLANEAGMMSAITPDLGGDIKLDQNTFLLEPVSSENITTNPQEIFGFMLMEKVPGQPQDVLLSSRLSFLMMTRSR